MKKAVRDMLWQYAVKMAFTANEFKRLKRRWNGLPWNERERVRQQFEAAPMRTPKQVFEAEGRKQNAAG
jgi:hypothetical protein